MPRADSAESVGQPGDFRVKLALTVCSAEPVADCGVCVFCLDKPKFGGAGAVHDLVLTPKHHILTPPRIGTPSSLALHPTLQRCPSPLPNPVPPLFAGTKRQSCVLRRTTPTGLPRVWTPLRVVSTQYLQQLEAYTSQVTLTPILTLTPTLSLVLALALTLILTLALTSTLALTQP